MMLHQVILAPAAGARVEFHCRVFSIAVYIPHHHAGGDWPGAALARWSSMIPSRLVLIRLLAAEGELQDWGACAGVSAGKPSGLPNSLEFF